MKFRRIIPVTMLTIALAIGSCGTLYADGRTSDEVIRKPYPKPVGYDADYQKKNKDEMYARNAAAMPANYPGSSHSTSTPSKTPTIVSKPINKGFTFNAEKYSMSYLRHEIGQDHEGKKTIKYYFTFTNKGDEATSVFATPGGITVYQNGIQCDLAVSKNTDVEMDNYTKKITPGTSIDVCRDYVIEDLSDVTIEFNEFLKDNKASQVLSLK